MTQYLAASGYGVEEDACELLTTDEHDGYGTGDGSWGGITDWPKSGRGEGSKNGATRFGNGLGRGEDVDSDDARYGGVGQ